MKDMAQVREIKKLFTNKFRHQIESQENNLSVGIGTNEAGDFTLRANLENKNGREILPSTFEGMTVSVSVIPEENEMSAQTTFSTLNTVAGRFAAEFREVFSQNGNNLGIGIKKDSNGKNQIIAYLTNSKMKEVLPESFEGVEISVQVIGKVKLL